MECALWYWSHGAIYYELCSDEQEAVKSAHDLYDYDEGAPAGVQYADGTYLDTKDWPEYQAEGERRSREAVVQAREAMSLPRPATRQIGVPWDETKTVSANADAPSWLGRQGRFPVGE
jgi:hypothetical protein